MLPPRIPKVPKRATRWRSAAHCNFVRSHACSACHSTAAIEVAHVRLGSGAGMGQKPDDHRTVSLCHECHSRQHRLGEATFWQGKDVVKQGRSIIGATNPLVSAPGTIRGDYAIDVGRNIIHGSDAVESAQHEIGLWFPEMLPIPAYERAINPWIYE